MSAAPAEKSLEDLAGPLPEDWEGEERSYVFECRLGRAQQLKKIGNDEFRAAHWALAHRYYKKALYHGHFDQLQCWDLMDKHKDMLQEVVIPVKLNNVVCILKLLTEGSTELDDSAVDKGDGEAETWLDRAEELCNEAIKMEPKNAKAHYRKSQVLEFRTDLPGAERCLDEVEKLEGKSSAVRTARQRLRDQRKAARERERQLYSGLIQEASVHKVTEAVAERREARRRLVLRVSHALAAPVTYPGDLLLRCILNPVYALVVKPLWLWLCALVAAVSRIAMRKFAGVAAPQGSDQHLHTD